MNGEHDEIFEQGEVATEVHTRLQAWNEGLIGPRHSRQLTLFNPRLPASASYAIGFKDERGPAAAGFVPPVMMQQPWQVKGSAMALLPFPDLRIRVALFVDLVLEHRRDVVEPRPLG
jgi:hypothetical protein